MTRRPRRPLSSEERRLWAEIARSVRPLPGRAPAPAPPPAAPPIEPEPLPLPVVTAATARAAPPTLPPLLSLERRTARKLARGRTAADGTLDLHGLTQTEAHARLHAFLRRAQAAGHGLVLVITGRGGREGEGGRGVLHRMAPLWLGLPDMRAIVLGFQEAGPRQGGSGALYVRLRRRRGGV